MKTLGIQVAQEIINGDISHARTLAYNLYSVSVPEGRAINKACEVANQKFGCNLKLEEFISPLPSK